MCCFAGSKGTIEHVSDTKIFARSKDGVRQFLVYEMRYKSQEDTAMILPLPTPENSKETAVQFINMKKRRKFFSDLEQGFPKRIIRGAFGGAGGIGSGAVEEQPKLKVKDVGDYEASFVPTVADFARLDERFRLPDTIWTETVPRYRDWGFAVFKLKSKNRQVHPMAMTFPRRNPETLFFPTLHIHDGEVHEEAVFDHALYCQISDGMHHDVMMWQESAQPAGMFILPMASGILDDHAHVYRKFITGEHKNRDILV